MTVDRLSIGSSLSRSALEGIQKGTMGYSYKGVPTWKNPFDMALYQMLLWEQKPKTLIEIGSMWGGSALWFSDILKTFGVDCDIHSVDLNPPGNLNIDRVVFHKGDANALGDTFDDAFMENLARPILVIDDADHTSGTTLAVLNFFEKWMKVGEYIVIEDGIVDDMYDEAFMVTLGGGPRVAIAEFLLKHGGKFEIDTRMCDHFGTNVTWNPNGYLRKMR